MKPFFSKKDIELIANHLMHRARIEMSHIDYEHMLVLFRSRLEGDITHSGMRFVLLEMLRHNISLANDILFFILICAVPSTLERVERLDW